MEAVKRELFSEISDAHKDAYGFRPHYMHPENMTVAELEKERDELYVAVSQTILDEIRQETKAVEEFESRVLATMKLGAGDRKTAMRWIAQAETEDDLNPDDQFHHDAGYVCYLLGIPYSYEQEFTVSFARN